MAIYSPPFIVHVNDRLIVIADSEIDYPRQ